MRKQEHTTGGGPKSPVQSVRLLAGDGSAGMFEFRVGAATLRRGLPALQLRPYLARGHADRTDQIAAGDGKSGERLSQRC